MVNVKQKQTKEERLEKKRQAERFRYQRIKNNLVKNVELKEKEKQKYYEKDEKDEKRHVKSINGVSEKAVRTIRRERVRKRRDFENKATLEKNYKSTAKPLKPSKIPDYKLESMSSKYKSDKSDNYEDVNSKNGDLNVKRQLVEVTEAVRRKFNAIKHGDFENKTTLEKIYEPITKPLKLMSKAIKPFNIPDYQLESASSKYKTHESDGSYKSITKPLKLMSAAMPSMKPSKMPDYQLESMSSKYKSDESGDDDPDDDDGLEENKASQMSFINTPPSSTFFTSPESEASIYSSGSSSYEQMLDLVRDHIENVKSGNPAYDMVYGVRVSSHTNKLRMGDVEIRFPNKNIELWRGNRKLATYQGSPELYDVIFLKNPSILNSSENIMNNFDVKTYMQMLKKTKAPYRNYDMKKGLNVSNTVKYRKLIQPLMSYHVITRSYTGEGLSPRISAVKSYNNIGVDYVYWNKPKKLVDRLRLLWSSKMDGYTGHDNEILSIIEELREEGIIY